MSEPFLVGGRPVPIAEELGAEIISHVEGRASIRFPVQDRHKNPMGILQGGMYAVMMDVAMAVASEGLATAAMQFSILRPASSGFVIASGEVVRRGRTLIYAEAEVRDEAGTLLARGNQTGMVRSLDSSPSK
jgi:uncharacterized protein (TIGR00369 family)